MPDIPDSHVLAQQFLTGGDGKIPVPDTESAIRLLGEIRGWHAQGHPEEQRAVCERLLAALPEHFEVLHLLGFAAQARGDFALAEEYYARALKAKPDFAFARLALGQLRMMASGFAEGRDLYEARFDAVTEGSGPDWRGLPVARWRGEPVAGKKVYVWAEQGLGDIVMFAEFLRALLMQQPARLVLGMFPKLLTLFARSFPDIEVEPIDAAITHALAPSAVEAYPRMKALSGHASVPFPLEPLEAAYHYVRRHGLFDVALPMGDLMVHAMPGFIPALHNDAVLMADPTRVNATAARLEALGKGRRIGISWHTTNAREWMRNIPLKTWLPLLRVPGCHFVSLQHGVDAEAIERFCAGHDCRITVDRQVDLLSDAEGLAALIAAMDEVITIDNANAHLAGGLGVPVTVLLPKGCNYRWPVLKEGGALWYKSMTVLRQCEAGDWREVMAQAAARLQNAG